MRVSGIEAKPGAPRASRMAAVLLGLALASCDHGSAPPPAETPASGAFLCVPSNPGEGETVESDPVTIAPGGSATVSVDSPPGSANLAAARVITRCQIDERWCAGDTCGGYPAVEFSPAKGGSLTWTADSSLHAYTFKMVAHNLDPKASHKATLFLEMPLDWHP